MSNPKVVNAYLEKGEVELHLLEVKALRVLYGKAVALNGLTLSINEKELVGVVGRMGQVRAPFAGISAMVQLMGDIICRQAN